MDARRFSLSLGLLVAAVSFGCGKDEPAAPTVGAAGVVPKAAEDDVAKLVPADAAVLLYAPSLERLESKVRAVVLSVDPAAAAHVSLDALLDDSGAPPFVRQNLDRTRPIAVAVSFPAGSDEPVFTIVAPTKELAVVVREVENMGLAKPATSGSYVAVTPPGMPQPAARGGAIAEKVPAGDLGVRVDVARIVARYRNEIDGALAQVTGRMSDAPGMPADGGFAGMARSIGETIASAVESAEWLDLALTVEGTRVGVGAELRVKAGSVLDGKVGASEVAGLAGHLPKDYPVMALATVDLAEMMGFFEKFVDAALSMFPEEQRSALLAQTRASVEAYRLLDREHAFGMGFGPGGMEGVSLSRAKDAQGYVAKSRETARAFLSQAADFGMTVEELPPKTIEGVEASGLRMRFDFEKMMASAGGGRDMPPGAMDQAQGMMQMFFGAEGLQTHYAAVDGKVLSVLGASDAVGQAVAAAKRGGKPPALLAESLRRAGGKPAFLLHVDVRALASQILDVVRRMMPPEQAQNFPTVPAGDPAVLLVHASGEGRTYRVGLSADVGSGAEVVRVLQQMGGGR
jgi:hypothetical protein